MVQPTHISKQHSQHLILMNKPSVRIYDWKLGYWPPESDHRVLWGIAVDHPGPFVSNNHMIKSSRVLRVDLKNNEVETQNTIYKLEGPEIDRYTFHQRLDNMFAGQTQ